MFIFDFVAETVLDQIIDWLYGKIVGFLNDFFAMMNNMGVELFDLPWVNAITTFFSWLGWALFVVGLVVGAFECAIEYQGGRGSIKDTALNYVKGFMAVSLFSILPVNLYSLSVSLQSSFGSALSGITDAESIGMTAQQVLMSAAMDWNRQENADLWRKAWADLANDYLERSGSAERIDHRSHAERGIEELPTVHMGVAASQMEKKGIATDKGEINRMIQKTNRLMREIRGYIDSLKEWLAEVFAAKKQLQAAPHSPDIATLLTRYLSIEREKSRKYSQGWQQQHTAGELQKISKAIVYLQSKGIATLEDLDAALSSVDEEAKRLNTSVVAKQKRMRTLEKFIEHGSNYNRLKPIHDELKTLKNGWGKKREKFEQAHESDLIIWNAANRFLHANLPEGTKSFKVSEWQKEFDELKAQSTGEYEELKTKRSEVKELQQIRKCIDIVEQAEQRTQEQTHQTPRRKKEDISL